MPSRVQFGSPADHAATRATSATELMDDATVGTSAWGGPAGYLLNRPGPTRSPAIDEAPYRRVPEATPEQPSAPPGLRDAVLAHQLPSAQMLIELSD